MIRVIRSELVRIVRPRLLSGWFGLTALFAVMVNLIMFSVAAETATAPTGPGVNFPTAAALAGKGGAVAGLASAASMFGVVTLAFWAIACANDYQTGLLRILASSQPRRWMLLVGKAIALTLLTGIASIVATVICLMVAPFAAQAAGISTSAWTIAGGIVLSAWLNTYAAMIVWGTIGLALATVFRSSAVAISVGVGYVLVVESIVGMAMDNPSWLLGSTMQALAAGGKSTLEYSSAGLLAFAYVLTSMAIATVLATRRDINV